MAESKPGKAVERKPRTGDLIIPPTIVQKESPRKKARPDSGPIKKTGILGYLAILILGIAAFSPIFISDLLWTDYDMVERSSFRSMESWNEAWSPESIRYGDPLTLSSYFAERALPFPDAPVHRVINLLLHLIAAIVLLRMLEALELPGALAATLVFAMHPAALQTLFWAGYRNELTALVLILASVYLGIKNRNAFDFLAMTILAAVAAILHNAALTIPAIIALCIFYQKRFFDLRDYNRLLPVFCLLLFIGVWTNAGVEGIPQTEGISQLTLIGQNMFFYLGQALLPVKMALFHPFTGGEGYSVGAQNSLLPFILFVPFYVLIAINHKKRWARGCLLGLTAFLILLLYGLSQEGRFVDGSLAKEDHALYVALPMIISLTICGLAALFRKLGPSGKVLWGACFSLLLLVQISITASFSYAVSDTPLLWKIMSKQWPESWVAKAALIDSVRKNQSDLLTEIEMIEALEEILEKNPGLHNERKLLARSYKDAGQSRNALREYRRLLRDTEPDDEFLEEAAKLFDQQGLNWEANNVRERIVQR